jgi:c-di-GMP-binding flagellar brake protein YcgR
MNDATFAERRKHDRFAVDKRVKFKSVDMLRGERHFFGRTQSLSEGGMGAYLTEELPPGVELSVEIEAGHHEMLHLKAVVRHRNGFLHGMEFLATTTAQREALRWLCLKEGSAVT